MVGKPGGRCRVAATSVISISTTSNFRHRRAIPTEFRWCVDAPLRAGPRERLDAGDAAGGPDQAGTTTTSHVARLETSDETLPRMSRRRLVRGRDPRTISVRTLGVRCLEDRLRRVAFPDQVGGTDTGRTRAADDRDGAGRQAVALLVDPLEPAAGQVQVVGLEDGQHDQRRPLRGPLDGSPRRTPRARNRTGRWPGGSAGRSGARPLPSPQAEPSDAARPWAKRPVPSGRAARSGAGRARLLCYRDSGERDRGAADRRLESSVPSRPRRERSRSSIRSTTSSR